MDEQTVHRIRRSIVAISLNALRDQQHRRDRDYDEGLTEYDQQFQLPIAGEATGTPSWFESDIDFSGIFIDAPAMRESPYSDPTFTFGAVVDAPVVVTASVVSWVRRDEKFYNGARVRVGVFAPGTVELVNFRGYVHLNFQGYGTVDPSDRTED